MGLDIVLYRIKKATDEDIKNHNYIPFFNDNKEDEMYKKEFPSWIFNFELNIESNELYNWEEYKNKYGMDINDLELIKKDGMLETYKFINSENKVIINLDKVPKIKTKPFKIIGLEEISNQEGGLNEKFYEDYENHKIEYYVWSKDKLDLYKNLYCDSLKEKKSFQENIIDKFVEGECCVTFDY